MVINYHFDFRLQFDINKKCIFQGFTEILFNNGMCNYMTQLSVEWSNAAGKRMSPTNVHQAKDATPLNNKFCFLCHPLCFSKFDALARQSTCKYLSVPCIWLYVLIKSRTSFRVNSHSVIVWMSSNSLLETGRYLEFKWLKLQISHLFWARSSLTFRQLYSVDSLWNAHVT